MKNILITGPCGYLGSYLVKEIIGLKQYNVYMLVEEINNFSQPLCKPDVVLHLASKHPSHNEGSIFDINVGATKKLASLCGKDTHFIFMSSDYVFRGNTHHPYAVDDSCEPRTDYGKSKLASEKFLMENFNKVTILRTSMLYGYYNPKRNNFIQFLVNSFKDKSRLELFTDVYCRPTHVGNICNFIFDVITTKKYGIFHACSSDYINRLDLAKEFCRVNNLDVELLWASEKSSESEWPLSINLQPSQEFLKLSTFSLEDGLKYNAKEI